MNEHGKIPEPNGAQSLYAMIASLELFAQDISIPVAYGINCAQKKSILKALAENTLAKKHIVLVYPNASHPTATSYTSLEHDHDGTLDEFFVTVEDLGYDLQFGGGCCGYTPTDIADMHI